jgi:putative molybdopterin biosynthesis protein
MQVLGTIDGHEQLAALSDGHRLAILRRLMCGPSTLSRLGRLFDKHPAWVRHHLKRLEAVGLVEPAGERTTGNYTEKFYRACAGAFSVHMLIAPATGSRDQIMMLGSDDFALQMLAGDLNDGPGDFEMIPSAIGSLDGLVALRQGLADIAGCHLFDAEAHEYNAPFLRHLFPDRALEMVTLAHREQGLMTSANGRVKVSDVRDLAGGGIRFANRNAGSGTRVWLDARLRELAIPPDAIEGYDVELRTHTDVALAVASGNADAGLGIRAAADRFGLRFTPLFTERYDLVFAAERAEEEPFARLRDRLDSRAFRSEVGRLRGYDSEHTGDGVRIGARV